MVRVIPYVIYLLLLAMYQVIFANMISIYGATVNLAALMVMLVASFKSEAAATWFGFFCGIVLAAGIPDAVGWQALVLALLGMVAFHFREKLNLESLRARLILVVSGVLAHNLLNIAIVHADAFWYRLFIDGVLGTIYTGLIAWLFYLVKEKKLTYQSIKSIF